jgi:hypothetical protein
MSPLTQSDMVGMLEAELHLRGRPWNRGELLAWLAAMWPWVEDDPDPYRWAGEFLEAARAGVMTPAKC